MRVSQLHEQTSIVVSFELFPPRTADAENRLFEVAIPEMLELQPAFFTCTYGAGGSTHDKTLEIVSRLTNKIKVEAASHLTCVGASQSEIAAYLKQAREAGIENIVALRGDAPEGDTSFKPHPGGFQHADELVSFIRSLGGFDIIVAGYPEGHPECPDKYLDWQRCANKVEMGANGIITQLFYNNQDFFEFEDYLKNKLGVKIPIVPGVLPILSTKQIKRFCGLCKAKLPDHVLARLDDLAEDNAGCRAYGIDLATDMCDELIRHGVPGIHFYTLNRADSTRAIMRNLGLLQTA